MKLYTPNNHVVVELEGQYYIVDTGSPFSFSFDERETLQVNNTEFELGMPLCSKEDPDQLTGMDIAGFIGLDILSVTGFTIDYQKQEFLFSTDAPREQTPEYYEMPFSSGMYIITDDLLVNNQHVRDAIIDTGAWMAYLSSEYLPALRMTEETYKDSNPLLGELQGNYYEGELSFDSMAALLFTHKVKFGKMPKILGIELFGAFVSPAHLTNNRVTFDFQRNVIGITK